MSGPLSMFVHPKMLEMDATTKNIYETLQSWNKNILILITGDHGMKDSGGHGGSTPSETKVPLVALGRRCSKGNLLQIDMACTISSIMGLKLPTSSIGTIAMNLLESLSVDHQLYILRYNYMLLINKLNICEDTIDAVKELHEIYLKTKDAEIADKIREIYTVCSNKISSALIKAAAKEDAYVLLFSAMLSVFCFLKIICCAANVSATNTKNVNVFVLFLILTQCFVINDICFFISWTCLCLVCLYYAFMILLQICSVKFVSYASLPLFFTCLHPFCFFSSSFIEEEHQIWYFYAVSIIMFSIFVNRKSFFEYLNKNIILFAAFRFVRKLNQTGDKWASIPDIAFWLYNEQNYVFLVLFLVFSLFLTFVCCLESAKSFNIPLIFSVLLLIFYFRLSGNDATIGKLIWLLIFVNFLLDIRNILVTWLLVGALLLRPHNVILLWFGVFASKIIFKSAKNENLRQNFHLWLENVLFFCQGHSNSLASVDVMSGYVGLNSYIPYLVILQVLCHTYIFPVLIYVLMQKSKRFHEVCLNIFILHRTLAMLITLIIVLIQRHHLFVWSVFAPKLLIEASHSIILYVLLMFSTIYKKYVKIKSK